MAKVIVPLVLVVGAVLVALVALGSGRYRVRIIGDGSMEFVFVQGPA